VQILVILSRLARVYKVYLVANVLEVLYCNNPAEICPDEDDDKFYLFNTNVVFDRTGAVIDRQAAVFAVFIFPLFTNITNDLYYTLAYILEELGGRAVSALGVRSRKLSTGLNGQSWDG
jgi:hypothetical protein